MHAHLSKKHRYRPFFKPSLSCGGAALEYVLVTTFAAACGLAALGFAATAMEDKLKIMAKELGVEAPEISLNPFASDRSDP